MFADDTTITAVADPQTQLHKYLKDFVHVVKWVENNKLVLSVDKTRRMTICTSRKRRKLKPWYLTDGNVQIKEVTQVKFCGVEIQNNLSWSTHVTDLSNRVTKMAAMIGRIAKFLSTHSQNGLS